MSSMSRSSDRRRGLLDRLSGLWKKPTGAARLAQRAGRAAHFGAEQLEERRLMFALTVTADDVDPNTGIGTVQASFGYVLPYLLPTGDIPDPTAPQARDMDFNDLGLGPVPSQSFLAESGIRVVHNIVPNAGISIVANGTNEQALAIDTPNAGQFYSFELWNEDENPTARTTATSVSFRVLTPAQGGPDTTGLLPDFTTITLTYNGALVATFTGDAIRAAIGAGGDVNNGFGTFTFNAPNGTSFDAVRITRTQGSVGPSDGDYELDDLSFAIPGARFVSLMKPRIVGAQATLSGPVGATVSFFDLYGRAMQRRISLGSNPNSDRVNVDANDDFVPDFNDGIGSIRFTGVDSRTAFSIIGGPIEETEQQPDQSDFFDATGFNFVISEDVQGGFYDYFEDQNFGFVVDRRQQQPNTVGLPAGPGSVIIGSHFVRDLNNYNPGGLPTGVTQQDLNTGFTAGFTRADQGVFVDNGQSIGSIVINGALFGSSRLTGFTDRFYAGYLLGSVTAKGDVGALIVGTDSGSWSPDGGFANGFQQRPLTSTNSQITLERTVGEVMIGGRLISAVTVLGDVNSPLTRPAREVYTYYEKEFVFGIDPATQDGELATLRAGQNNTSYVARQPSQRFRDNDVGFIIGDAFYRNDSLIGSEFIGGTSTAVRIVGDLSGRDPTQDEDAADVYAFAVDGTRDVVFEATGGVGIMRVVNQFGETVGAPSLNFNSQTGAFGGQLRFRPDGAGVYYLVVTDSNFNDNGFTLNAYSINVSGLASSTLGQLHTMASIGYGSIGASVSVLSGDIGSVRVGAGRTGAGGGLGVPVLNLFGGGDADALLSFMGGTISAPGSMWSLVAGSDIGTDPSISGAAGTGTIVVSVGGNFGSLWTGQAFAGNAAEGDLNFFTLNVGGALGEMNIQGGIGMDQDPQNANRRAGAGGPGSIQVRTGTGGGRGDIGFIRTGWHVAGDTIQIRTSPGSIIGGLFVSEAAYGDGDPRSGIYDGNTGLPIFSGIGSDVRFVDTPQRDEAAGEELSRPLFNGQTLTLVDDSGTIVQITVSGGVDGVLAGQVRALPIDGSLGVAIGAIEVDLSQGRTLNIVASGPGVASIGTIEAIGRRAGSLGLSDITSNINISGTTQVDVYRILAVAMDTITNSTPGGDIVAVDVGALNALRITNGNLGNTQRPALTSTRNGFRLGVATDLQGGVLNPLGAVLNAGVNVDDNFNGDVFRPVNDEVVDDTNAYLDDIGGPMDGYLNGLVVRNGNLQEVTVSGTIGDVILQGAGAILGPVRANSDGVSAIGSFEGITGSIYAAFMVDIDLGAGISAPDNAPLSTTGIFANDDILNIRSSQTGAIIRSTITAGNAADQALGGVTDGITDITLNAGRFENAYIGATHIDGFWIGTVYGDDGVNTGDITTLGGPNTDMFRTEVNAQNLTNFNLGGVYDASSTNVTGDVDSITLGSTRNSTLTGSTLEFLTADIVVAGNVNRITVNGDMNDLVVDVVGQVSGGITARNINRSRIEVDNEVQAITASQGIHGSNIRVGRLVSLRATDSVESSTVEVSGPFGTFDGGRRIASTSVVVSGPAGDLGSMRARELVSGSIISSGPVNAITSDIGDVVVEINTTTSRGNVGTITAGRDVRLAGDISGNLSAVSAQRHIGAAARKDVILVRGNLANATARTGQLYADLRVGGEITGTVSAAAVVNKPGLSQQGTGSVIAFGRINAVSVTGDFGGDIISYSGGIGSVTITNGSLLPGRTIAAYSGDINSVTINNGNLYGNVHADQDIRSLRVTGGSDGVFGDVGVNPEFSQFTGYDGFRNRLPVGVEAGSALQGLVISAGRDIVSIAIPNGSAFETVFQAGQIIRSISVGGFVSNDGISTGYGSGFVAGDTIDNVTISGGVGETLFLAGVVDLGSDNRPGGTGAAADRVKSGVINRVAVNGLVRDSQALAGIQAGPDGLYGTSDDRTLLGTSSIQAFTASTVQNVRVASESLGSALAGDGRFIRDTATPQADALLDTGIGAPGVRAVNNQAISFGSGTVTFAFSGPGEVWFDSATGRATLRNSTSASSVTVSSTLSSLTNFSIVSNNGAALGTLRVNPALTGASNIVIDGNVGTLQLAAYSGAGRVTVGGDVNNATFASFASGSFSSRALNTLTITGDFGSAASTNRPRIDSLSAGTLNFRGAASGIVSVDRNTTSINASAVVDRAAFRVGGNLGTFTAPSMRQSILSVGRSLTTATINGDVFDSFILAGVDLGRDATFGGTGVNADTATSATIGTVTVAGNFQESDLVASYLRGQDAFYGTSDDSVAPGLSSIGTVTIRGSAVGSSRSSESYRVASSGTVGTVTVGGQNVAGSAVGNFAVESGKGTLAPVSIQIDRVETRSDGGIFTAFLYFNQPIDASTILPALSVSEVRGTGDVTIRLIDAVDYSLSYDPAQNAARVTFSRSVTERNLPQVPGRPGPGVYRFELDQRLFRGKSLGARVDGNGDGFSQDGDDYAAQAIVGDAGDKLTNTIATSNGQRVDFYAPANLDLVMDSVTNLDGLPDANSAYTVRGVIGDHADHSANNFPVAGDTDLYSITLQAGQILQLSGLRGDANLASFSVLDPSGNALARLTANGNTLDALNQQTAALELPTQFRIAGTSFVQPLAYLIRQTGTYTIVVSNAGDLTPGTVPQVPTTPGSIGSYDFDVTVFDDGDSGFTADVDSGDGTGVVAAPLPSVFAGIDQQLGTADDLKEVAIDAFTFTLAAGADNVLGTADDVVSGSNGAGITSTRIGDQVTSSIASSIGPGGHAGIPTDVTSDVDIFHLNNRAPIAAGTRMKITVKLAQTGADLGSSSSVGINAEEGFFPPDRRGAVQFGLFETTGSTVVDDASLVFSPTDFSPVGGTPNTVIADNGTSKYGYDANGDFYIEFAAPSSVVNAGQAGSFAVYLQGVYNNDYTIEVVTGGSAAIQRRTQNILVETAGGSVNWLEAGGLTTGFGRFESKVLGFTGVIGTQTTDQYVISQTITQLNTMFRNAGMDVRFSNNAADFEFQPFSTIFLTNNIDPLTSLFESFDFVGAGGVGAVGNNPLVFSTQPFGFSEHSDPFNTDLEDEGIVFAPSFGLLGLTSSRADVDVFVDALTGAIGRRAGELMGLRVTADDFQTGLSTFDVMAANSVDVTTGTPRQHGISNANRRLSTPFDSITDTDFFLGAQRGGSLLQQWLAAQ